MYSVTLKLIQSNCKIDNNNAEEEKMVKHLKYAVSRDAQGIQNILTTVLSEAH